MAWTRLGGALAARRAGALVGPARDPGDDDGWAARAVQLADLGAAAGGEGAKSPCPWQRGDLAHFAPDRPEAAPCRAEAPDRAPRRAAGGGGEWLKKGQRRHLVRSHLRGRARPKTVARPTAPYSS